MAFLNYHHLRYFWTTANQGGLTRAARRLNVSPSSLSVQLKTLEEQLGHALFERRHRALQLTEAGRIALAYANTVFKSGDELLNTLKGLEGDARRTLRIGAVATLSRNFQIELIRPLIGRRDVEVVIKGRRRRGSLDPARASRPRSRAVESAGDGTSIGRAP